MGNRTLSPEVQVKAQEFFRSWLNAVEVFLGGYVGRALLEDLPEYRRPVMRSALIAQIQVPDDVDEQLARAIQDMRFEKRMWAKSQLREVLSAHNMNDQLEREWVALEADARGNVSSVKRVSSWSLKAVQPDASPSTAGPETLPAPPSEPESPESDSKSTMPAPPIPGRPTIPAAYNPQALQDWNDTGKVPSLDNLFSALPVDAVFDVEVPVEPSSTQSELNLAQAETRRAIIPPPSDQEDAPEIQVEEDLGAETPTSEMDLVFEQFLKDD